MNFTVIGNMLPLKPLCWNCLKFWIDSFWYVSYTKVFVTLQKHWNFILSITDKNKVIVIGKWERKLYFIKGKVGK